MKDTSNLDSIRDRLKIILYRFVEEALKDMRPEVLSETSLSDLGLDSFTILSFMVAVEDEFGIEWDDNLPAETFQSLNSMTLYIGRQLGTKV